jgi:ATP-binding cassette subfamily B (MDR/TAP) protein 1
MSLIFSNLTQGFVTFGLVANEYYQSLQSNDADLIEQAQMALDAAGSEFRHNASQDAAYLAYLGMFLNRLD